MKNEFLRGIQNRTPVPTIMVLKIQEKNVNYVQLFNFVEVTE